MHLKETGATIDYNDCSCFFLDRLPGSPGINLFPLTIPSINPATISGSKSISAYADNIAHRRVAERFVPFPFRIIKVNPTPISRDEKSRTIPKNFSDAADT